MSSSPGPGGDSRPSFLYRQTPNLLTLLRIAAAPAVFLIVLQGWSDPWLRLLALVVFVAAAITDGIDGKLARSRNLISNLGKLLDPIADKLLIGAALVALALVAALDWWFVIAIIARELLVTGYRLWVLRRQVLAASGWGKLKTVLQIVAVSFVLAPLNFLGEWFGFITLALLAAALVTTWATAAHYFYLGWRERD
jgi:CDP-diacylglycerol--glycerol-3-phosphate 3-phosphatidyltransferase